MPLDYSKHPKLSFSGKAYTENEAGELVPDGVELVDPHDYGRRRSLIYDKAKSQFERSFPQSWGGVRVEVDKVDYADPDTFDKDTQQQTLLRGGVLARRLRGTMRLIDEASGDVLDEKELTLARIPHLTERGTFIHNGNEYTTVMQSRLVPSVYTRRKANGQLETQFGTRRGTGRQFRLGFDPETAQYHMQVGTSRLHLYSLLKDLGHSDEDLRKRWGDAVFEANAGRYDARVFPKAFEHFVPARDRTPEDDQETRKTKIRAAWDRMQMQKSVAARNLPNLYDRTKAASWQIKAAAREAVDATVREFEPDFTPSQIPDVYNSIYGRVGPRLASMKSWPESWMHNDDQMGWLEWYEKYDAGRRHEDDARQMMRWRKFKARMMPLVRRTMSPRLYFAMRNWAIDAYKLVPEEHVAEFRAAVEAYRDKEQERDEVRQRIVDPGKGWDLVKEAAVDPEQWLRDSYL